MLAIDSIKPLRRGTEDSSLFYEGELLVSSNSSRLFSPLSLVIFIPYQMWAFYLDELVVYLECKDYPKPFILRAFLIAFLYQRLSIPVINRDLYHL